jgi:hypothetical protein
MIETTPKSCRAELTSDIFRHQVSFDQDAGLLTLAPDAKERHSHLMKHYGAEVSKGRNAQVDFPGYSLASCTEAR